MQQSLSSVMNPTLRIDVLALASTVQGPPLKREQDRKWIKLTNSQSLHNSSLEKNLTADSGIEPGTFSMADNIVEFNCADYLLEAEYRVISTSR